MVVFLVIISRSIRLLLHLYHLEINLQTSSTDKLSHLIIYNTS